MSTDPRDQQLNPQPIPPDPEVRRKGTSPLVLLLLLLVVLALGWYFYNRSTQGVADTTPAATTTEPAIGSEQENAARAENERAAANEARKKERAAAAKKPAVRADREVSPVASLTPDYPPAAYRNGEEGTVLVRVDVDAQGNPTNVDVAKRSGSRDLDRAAVNAVRTWKFNPAIKDGKQVASTAQVPVEFKLDRQ